MAADSTRNHPSPTELLMRHRTMARPDEAERAALDALVTCYRDLGAGEVLAHQMVDTHFSAILVSGMLSRYVVGPQGDREMVALHVPGDYVDLHGFVLKRLDHEVVATIDGTTVALIPHAALSELLAHSPALERKLWFMTLLDAALHRCWLYRVARTPAFTRIANFLCEINLRLMAVDQSDGHTFGLPVTQQEISEICGLTPIHVNRVLRLMRDRGLCTVRKQIVTVHALGSLCAEGHFDPDYLYFDHTLLDRFHAAKETDP